VVTPGINVYNSPNSGPSI